MLYMQKISFDLSNQQPRQRLSVVYGSRDTIAVELFLFNGSDPWVLPAGTSCVVRFMKANGNGGVYHSLRDGTEAWKVESNQITIQLIPEALDTPGLLDVSVVAVNNGRTLGIYGFDVHVECNIVMPMQETDDLLEFSNLSEINVALAALQTKTDTDTSLSISNRPADASAVGAALENKAPAGYGLGENAMQVDTWDNAISNGFYASEVGGPVAGRYYGITHSYDGSGSWVVQRVWSNDAGGANYSATRRKTSNGWGAWEWETPPMELGVEYRTTERWQGKTVYTQLCDIGTLPNAAHKNVSLNIFPARVLSHETSFINGNNSYTGSSGISSLYVASYGGQASLNIQTTTDLSAFSGTVTVKYTKD